MNNPTKTILIVEDDYSIRESLKTALEIAGYSVVAAENGEVGLQKLRSLPKPSLVLLDMMMPIMDGRAFLDAVLEDSVLAPIPVFVVSAAADKDKTKGAVGFMKKPADLGLLLKLVAQYLAA